MANLKRRHRRELERALRYGASVFRKQKLLLQFANCELKESYYLGLFDATAKALGTY